MNHCRFPGCRHSPIHLARLPMSDRYVWVCQRHRGIFFLAAMRALVA